MRFSIGRSAAVAALLLALLLAPLLAPVYALTAEPVRHIGIYVEPFYRSARMPNERPQVGVGKQYNDLLSSTKRAWVKNNPYEVMFMVRAPALPGDRAENHKRAIANANDRAAKERAYFDDAKNVAVFYATRKTNEADAKFCWK